MPYSATWFDQNIKRWEQWLAPMKGKPGLHFLEVGCFEGRATVWLLENILTHETSEIETIDMFGGGMEDGDKGAFFTDKAFQNYEENTLPFAGKVRTHVGESGEILREYDGKPRFDFIYIDGSHRSPEVLEDSVLCWRLLKPGGIMVWDDYGLTRYPEPLDNPAPAITAFISIYKDKCRVLHKGYQFAVIKR